MEFSVSEFEAAVAPLLKRSTAPITAVLASLGLRPSEISEVVLVGGTSRMPQIRNLVRKTMQRDKLNLDIDPDVTVAWGCASVID